MTIAKPPRKVEILLNVKKKLREERNWEIGFMVIIESAATLGFEGCGLFLVDPVRKTLNSHLGRGTYPPERRKSLHLENTEHLGVRCVLEKRTTRERDHNPGGTQIVSDPDFHVWVPIIVQDTVFGVVAVEGVKSRHGVTDTDVTALETLAGLCADFIERTKISVTPVPEIPAKTEFSHQLRGSEIYVVVEKKPVKSLEIFVDVITHRIPGLAISRTHPEKLRKEYKLARTPLLWLSRYVTENSVSPDDISKLNYIISEFTQKSEKSVILLDGLEYLIIQVGFETVLTYLKELRDTLVINNAKLIIPLHKGTLSQKEYTTLEEEFIM
jgi:hypothetical protein